MLSTWKRRKEVLWRDTKPVLKDYHKMGENLHEKNTVAKY